MALKVIMGFDHLPQSDVLQYYMPHGLTKSGNLVLKDGWITPPDTTSSTTTTTINLGKFFEAGATRITLGFRIRFDYLANLGVFGTATGTGVGVPSLLSVSEFVNTLGAASVTTPMGMIYFEIQFRTSGEIIRRANGVTLPPVSTTANVRDWKFNFWHKSAGASIISIRDIYVTDDLGAAQGQPVDFLGPVVAIPAALAVTEAVDYTTVPPGGSVADAIYQPGSPPDTLVAQSPSSRNPLKAAISANIPDGVEIFGIDFGIGIRSDAASATTVSSKLKVGSDEVAGGSIVAPTNAFNYSLNFGAFGRAPNGEKWTKASINSAILTLQPEA